jgi:hypothetical protein
VWLLNIEGLAACAHAAGRVAVLPYKAERTESETSHAVSERAGEGADMTWSVMFDPKRDSLQG